MDRGKESVETMCLLFAYKVKYPENFFLLRGNHECAGLNRYAMHKINQKVNFSSLRAQSSLSIFAPKLSL